MDWMIHCWEWRLFTYPLQYHSALGWWFTNLIGWGCNHRWLQQMESVLEGYSSIDAAGNRILSYLCFYYSMEWVYVCPDPADITGTENAASGYSWTKWILQDIVERYDGSIGYCQHSACDFVCFYAEIFCERPDGGRRQIGKTDDWYMIRRQKC